jgi:hypothetical protein
MIAGNIKQATLGGQKFQQVSHSDDVDEVREVWVLLALVDTTNPRGMDHPRRLRPLKKTLHTCTILQIESLKTNAWGKARILITERLGLTAQALAVESPTEHRVGTQNERTGLRNRHEPRFWRDP